MQGIARSLREDLAVDGKVKVEDSSPVLTWLVKHAGHMYTLSHRGEPFDGMAPYQRSKGTQWEIALPPFGEVVEYRVRAQNKLHPRWAEGAFLGVSLASSEKSWARRKASLLCSPFAACPKTAGIRRG